MRWLHRLTAKQLRHPSGFFGRRVARRMNVVNLEIYELALANLEVRHNDQLLDIGFGGGPAFRGCAIWSQRARFPVSIPQRP